MLSPLLLYALALHTGRPAPRASSHARAGAPRLASRSYAVLVDAENAQAAALGAVLTELSTRYGDCSVRRAYADFTKPNLQAWRQVTIEHSFRCIQQFEHVSGKSSSDFALVIDAMDLLHCNTALDGFVIVSSDSDFTGLAQRLRESGKDVVGVGERKTPKPFITACSAFVFTENLHDASAPAPWDTLTDETVRMIRSAVEASVDDRGAAEMSRVAKAIRQSQPDFDLRSYGYKRQGLSCLLRQHPKLAPLFAVEATEFTCLVRCADAEPASADAKTTAAAAEPGAMETPAYYLARDFDGFDV